MTTSLARQLAQVGSIDASRLDNPTSKARDSFLFTARQAATLSYTDVHSLGYNGFLALAAENDHLLRFDGPIFGEKAKVTDRALLTKDEDKKLDRNIQSLLIFLGPKFLVKNAGKVLEWLIRRFRINELNVEDVLRIMLPYHETPQFAQMLQILKLDDPRFIPLQAVKKALQPLPRAHLTTAMSKSPDLLRFVAGCLKHALSEIDAYSALLNFWTASLSGYLDGTANVDETSMAILLPAVVDAVRSRDGDVMLAGLVVLGRMAAKIRLNTETLELLTSSILSRRLAEQSAAVIEAAFTALIVLTETQQDENFKFPVKVVLNIAHSQHLQDTLVSSARTYNVARLVKPMMKSMATLIATNETAAGFAYDLLAPVDCPVQITTAALPALISTLITDDMSTQAALRILYAISQREPDLYYATCTSAAAGEELSQSDVQALQSAVARFGITASGVTSDATIDIALVSSVEEGRAEALKTLLGASDASKTKAVPARLKAVVIERLRDPAVAVTEVLFAPQGKAILRALIKEDPAVIFDASCSTVTAHSIPRASAIAHARFLLGTFLDTVPAADRRKWCQETLRRCFWPRLLCTKANRKLWSSLVDLVVGNIASFPLLAGLEKIQRGETKEAAVSFNKELSRLLAKQIQELAGPERDDLQAFILRSAHGTKDSSQAASMILSVLILGDILSTNATPQLCGAVLRASFKDGTQQSLGSPKTDEPAVHDLIFSKPESRRVSTTLQAQLILKAFFGTTPTAGCEWSWMSAQAQADPNVHNYAMVVKALYHCAHSASCSPAVATTLLQHLYIKLVRTDLLAFLASIYTDAAAEQHLRIAALRETGSFVAMSASSSSAASHDYQTVLPSLLGAVGDIARPVREIALKVIADIQKQTSHETPAAVYGFDNFYGSSQSSGLKYLDNKHIQAYLGLILDNKAALLLDGSGLYQLHGSVLSSAVEKKKSAFRRAVAQYLSSHLQAWRDIPARITLLSCLRHIKTDESKLELLLPVVELHLGGSDKAERVPPSILSTYCVDLAAVVCTPPSDAERTSAAFTQVLSLLATQGHQDVAISIRNALRESVISSLLQYASVEQQISFLRHLVQTLRSESKEQASAKSCLLLCRVSGDVTALYLDSLREATASSQEHAKKMRSDHGKPRGTDLLDIELFLSSVDSASMEPTAGLLASLMEVLALAVDASSTDRVDAIYLAQLLLNLIYDLAKKTTNVKFAADDHFRISPLLDLLRTSTSQQLLNQVLDLLAVLVDLAPDQVLRNIMPIFTFMGVNTMHRDDAHSFRVVDRTTGQLLPALLRSKRRRGITTEVVLDDMDELLQLFTDAANHMPRHRRSHLFIRLVDVLGPRDFLAPVCTKLVQKVSSKLLRSQDTALLSLPLSVLTNYPANDQIKALDRMLRNAAQDLVKIGSLDPTLSRDSTPSSMGGLRQTPATVNRPVSKRAVLASFAFINLCLQDKALASKFEQSRRNSSEDAEELVQDLIQQSLAMHELPTSALASSDVTASLTVADRIVHSAAALLSTAAFSEMMLRSLGSKSTAIKRNAHAMLLERLSAVKKTKRQLLGPALVECIADLVHCSIDMSRGDDCLYGLRVLRSLAVFASDHEAGAMTQAVGTLAAADLQSVPQRIVPYALAFFADVVPKLGARAIPYGRSMTKMALHALAYAHTISTTSSRKLVKNCIISALFTINSLTLAVPTIVQLDLLPIVSALHRPDLTSVAIAEEDTTVAAAVAASLSTIIKATPFENVLSALAALWDKVDSAQQPNPAAIADTLVRLIKSTKAAEVGEKYKAAFTTLLRVLDFRASAVDVEVISRVERTAINAFMQLALKLNEATFRPLFLRLHDWAAIEAGSKQLRNDRLTILFRIMDRLLSQLKAIVAPYFAHLLDSAAELLQDKAAPSDLERSVLACLQRSLDSDSTGFWTVPRLNKILMPMIERLTYTQAGDGLAEKTLVSLARSANDEDTVLHAIVRALLEKTRLDDSSTQLACVRALHTLWQSDLQGQLAAYAAESAPFLVELLEHPGEIARETKLLLKTMEAAEDDAQASDSSADGSDSEMEEQDE